MPQSTAYQPAVDKATELAAEGHSRENTGVPGPDTGETGVASSVFSGEKLPFGFTGNAGEYFRIWVVNVFLTIVSLGIYSAWAKVRTNRYFYGNTILDGSPFDYDAKPIAILKGRLIAVAVIAVYLVAITYYPATEPFFLLAFLLALPWLLVKAFTFRARCSSYRNVRFNFVGTYGEAAGVLFGFGLLTGVTFGLAYPIFIAARNRFLVSHTRFGTTPLSFEVVLKKFYWVYFVTVLIFLAIVVPGSMAVVHAVTTVIGNGPEPDPGAFAIGQLMLAAFGVTLYLVINGYLKAALTNIVFRHTAIGEHRFESTLNPVRMIWLYLSNAVAIACSIGLLVPWARIRMARYRAEQLTLLAASDLDSFAAEERQKAAAAGEEISEFLDVDVGI